MMSTQNQAEHGVIQSSIALLQERFKQLQRVKEMREKKELINVFSDNYKVITNTNPNNYDTLVSPNTTTTTNDGDVIDINDDDEVQIFLPPNYYYSNRKPSCYSSSLSSSSSLLSNNNNNEISLSLWPPAAVSYTNATAAAAVTAEHFRRAQFETPVSTMSSSRPSSCISSVYKFEDSHHHVSDVDTTLHL